MLALMWLIESRVNKHEGPIDYLLGGMEIEVRKRAEVFLISNRFKYASFFNEKREPVFDGPRTSLNVSLSLSLEDLVYLTLCRAIVLHSI